MNRLERLTAILLYLQERPRTAGEIGARFEVSRRTVFRDIQALCEMGVPVIAREGSGGGYQLPEDYTLAPLALSARESFLLLFALNALDRPTADLFRLERASLQAKLRALLPPAQLTSAEQQLRKVSLDGPTSTRREEFLEDLLAAANAGRWLVVTYRSAERTSRQHILPRCLQFQEGLWYCRAFSLEREEERTYRVDRFVDLAPANEHIQALPPPAGAAQPYASPEDPLMRVSLTRKGAAMIERDPHIGPLLQVQDDGSAILEMHFPARELEWYTLMFAGLGGEVSVEQPAELRQRLAELGQNLLSRYAQR